MRIVGIICLSAAASWVMFYARVMRPLRLLAAKAKQLSEGDFTALEQRYSGVPEIDSLRAAMNAMVGHVRRAQAQERTYIEALTNGQEAERTRIARELHDDTVQSLIAIAQSLEIAQEMLGEASLGSAMLKAAREQAIGTVDNLRRLIANLRPPILAELGLVPALQVLAESTHQIPVNLDTDGHVRRLRETQELVLFRSAQEAIWNAQRHGQAKHVNIQLNYQPDVTRLIIQDDGKGFELPLELDTLSLHGHYGLVGIQERVQHLDGTFHIVSAPNAGTRIDISIPARETIQPGEVVRDPVCSAIIQPQEAYASLEYKGTRYYFCCPVCQGAFQTTPEIYLLHNTD
jgi:signal transduction histidine kinase/YHS domain-containing protein